MLSFLSTLTNYRWMFYAFLLAMLNMYISVTTDPMIIELLISHFGLPRTSTTIHLSIRGSRSLNRALIFSNNAHSRGQLFQDFLVSIAYSFDILITIGNINDDYGYLINSSDIGIRECSINTTYSEHYRYHNLHNKSETCSRGKEKAGAEKRKVL